MRLHLRYKHLKPAARRATEDLFALKPWRLKDEADAEEVLSPMVQEWADKLCSVYSTPHVTIHLDFKTGTRYGQYFPAYVTEDAAGIPDGMGEAKIILGYFSLATMFWRFGQHLQSNGHFRGIYEDNLGNSDYRYLSAPLAWAFSLFYTCKPVMFRKRAREGRLACVNALDTYSKATLDQFAEAGIDPRDLAALDRLRDAENEAVSLDEPAVSEDAQLAEVEALTAADVATAAEQLGAPIQNRNQRLLRMSRRQLLAEADSVGITGATAMSTTELLTALGVTGNG